PRRAEVALDPGVLAGGIRGIVDQRRVERRQVRVGRPVPRLMEFLVVAAVLADLEVAVLVSGPGAVDQESREAEESRRRSEPPGVAAGGRAEPRLHGNRAHLRHGTSLPPSPIHKGQPRRRASPGADGGSAGPLPAGLLALRGKNRGKAPVMAGKAAG